MVPGFCQDGEESIIAPVFAGMGSRGMVVDIGAGDGVFLSQSRGLILAGWHGVLVDPLPAHAEQLRCLYADNPRVRVIHCAVGPENGSIGLHEAVSDPYVSTAVDEWCEIAKTKGASYGADVTVPMRTLADLFVEVPGSIDFLTVDAEMMDLAVLQSNDWKRWRPWLVCAECPQGKGSNIDLFMRSVGYRFHGKTRINSFWMAHAR